jgi:integrase
VLRRAGLPRFRLYDLRHTFATQLLAGQPGVALAGYPMPLRPIPAKGRDQRLQATTRHDEGGRHSENPVAVIARTRRHPVTAHAPPRKR